MAHKHEARAPTNGEAVVPQPNDILLGRGKSIASWPGNQRYQIEIGQNTERYRDAATRSARARIVTDVIDSAKTWARFLDQAGDGGSGEWYMADTAKVRKKVGQALRYQVEMLEYSPSPRKDRKAAPPNSPEALPAANRTEAPEAADSQDAKPAARENTGGVAESDSSSGSSFGVTLEQLASLESPEQRLQPPLLSDSEILSSIGYENPHMEVRLAANNNNINNENPRTEVHLAANAKDGRVRSLSPSATAEGRKKPRGQR